MAKHPLTDSAEVEVICPHCGYRMMRTAARLRRENSIGCPSCGELIVPSTDERREQPN